MAKFEQTRLLGSEVTVTVCLINNGKTIAMRLVHAEGDLIVAMSNVMARKIAEYLTVLVKDVEGAAPSCKPN